MDLALLIGMSAASLTTIAFLPQVIKAFKSKHTKDLSLLMYLVLSFGLVLWLCYGILMNSLPVILANSVTLSFSLFLVYLKTKYG
ncbi:MAG: SemiSWEET transporter [Candidatus Margulisbacteria bacterium]|nr:SemiSWEET transporter [Candidatus Margulisiibacteriota bacterium]